MQLLQILYLYINYQGFILEVCLEGTEDSSRMHSTPRHLYLLTFLLSLSLFLGWESELTKDWKQIPVSKAFVATSIPPFVPVLPKNGKCFYMLVNIPHSISIKTGGWRKTAGWQHVVTGNNLQSASQKSQSRIHFHIYTGWNLSCNFLNHCSTSGQNLHMVYHLRNVPGWLK